MIENNVKISRKGEAGAVVTIYSLFIMLILSFIIIKMSQKTVVFIVTRADTYLEKQAYWNAQSGKSIAFHNKYDATITRSQRTIDAAKGWANGEIVIPTLVGEPEGTTSRRGLPDIIKTIGHHQTITLTNPVFSHNGVIPLKYACVSDDGLDVNPALNISNVPGETASLALIMDDPDADYWVHWLVWKIAPETTNLAEASDVPGEAREGENDFGSNGYGGPCPPSGTHRYNFNIYALDIVLELAEGSTRDQLETEMAGHILARGRLTGTYTKPG